MRTLGPTRHSAALPPGRPSARGAGGVKRASRPVQPKAGRVTRQEVLYVQVDEGEMVPIRKEVFLIGRGSKCDLVLPHRSVSREHAVITKERGGWFVEDLNSANGTWLDNEQIGKHKISGGDVVQVANHAFTFAFRPG